MERRRKAEKDRLASIQAENLKQREVRAQKQRSVKKKRKYRAHCLGAANFFESGGGSWNYAKLLHSLFDRVLFSNPTIAWLIR